MELHNITSQKIVLFKTTSVSTSNSTLYDADSCYGKEAIQISLSF
jgi:hypothetical protein